VLSPPFMANKDEYISNPVARRASYMTPTRQRRRPVNETGTRLAVMMCEIVMIRVTSCVW